MRLNLPALLVGCIVAIYWARVVRLMRKSKRRVGRLANFIPPEPVGLLTRLIWVPVVALWITLPLLAGLRMARGRGLDPLVNWPVLGWCAVAAALIAFVLTLICWKRMGRSWRIGIDPSEKNPLVVTGPYAYVRHPIYALSSLLMLASVAACPSPIMIGVGLIHLALLRFEISREEVYLTGVHGGVYTDYCRTTGRFIPPLLRLFSSRISR
jgi:protein-S-isoprenylcysteine O-methyltransferase Ste14